MPLLEIDLLGPPVARYQGREIPLGARKPAALLYYLVSRPAYPLGRAQLATLLWEEHSEAEGRNSLSTALNRLRRTFSMLPFFPIVASGDSIAWQPNPDVRTDLDRFAELTSLARDAGDGSALDAAVALYRGPFLDGFDVRDSVAFSEWVQQERERWHQRILATYGELIELDQRRNQNSAAILHVRQALRIDPLQEQLHRTLMGLYYQNGDRASALAQFQTCERLLREALDVGPSAETRSLRDAIVAGRGPRSASRPATDLDGEARLGCVCKYCIHLVS